MRYAIGRYVGALFIFGLGFVIGIVLALAIVSDPSLWAVAGDHEPLYADAQSDRSLGRWLICVASGPRTVPGPHSFEVRDAEWELDVHRSFELLAPYTGRDSGHVGRLRLRDPNLTARALDLFGAPV